MNKLYLIAIGALLSGIITVQAQEWKPQQWPVLKKYDKEHLYQIALPLGGIGTGTVSLGGRGELRPDCAGGGRGHYAAANPHTGDAFGDGG